MKMITNALIILISLPTLQLVAQTSHGNETKVTGIYSDMHYNEESGDVIGTEVFVVYARGGYYVVFQESEGLPDPPVVLNAQVQDTTITFALPTKEGSREKFSGVISAWGLRGSFDSGRVDYKGHHTFELKRKLSYWQ